MLMFAISLLATSCTAESVLDDTTTSYADGDTGGQSGSLNPPPPPKPEIP